MRDHGGNLDAAIAEFGGHPAAWLDLSTGINPAAYSLPALSDAAWNTLPTKSAQGALIQAAKIAYSTDWACLPTAGAQAGIQMLPRILSAKTARIFTPTYNEHAASMRAAGLDVEEVETLCALEGAELAVVVNPNNPTGDFFEVSDLVELASKVGCLVIDESFCDPHAENSVLSQSKAANVVVFRSFGKFYGLAGLRLGFVLGSQDIVGKISELSGPWPVSGPAIEVGCAALSDTAWKAETIARLAKDAARMDAMATANGWVVKGGTTLFRLYETDNAVEAQHHLARHHIWSRIFPYSDRWIRLGLPHGEHRWDQLEKALTR
ncbi:MAG: threonine-phosphate decarboxylase CobD [Paracoccaceae bacterium]|nr:threonine-phosphate decarboxylase CobD [Paracoccaceae bacterium]MDG2259678.1 threonine-phosphate decarboxylase CobD [Paracoccaceae bacterium]